MSVGVLPANAVTYLSEMHVAHSFATPMHFQVEKNSSICNP